MLAVILSFLGLIALAVAVVMVGAFTISFAFHLIRRLFGFLLITAPLGILGLLWSLIVGKSLGLPRFARLRSLFKTSPRATATANRPVRVLSGQLVGSAVAIDGDTISVCGKDIRILGIDTPEIGQPTGNGSSDAGILARSAMASLLRGRTVVVRIQGEDVYNRLLATAEAGGEDLGLAMLTRGMAMADESSSSAYRRAESDARRRRTGLWAAGGFSPPSQHRRLNSYRGKNGTRFAP